MPVAAAAEVAVVDDEGRESSLEVSLLELDSSGESDMPDFILQDVGVHLNSRSGCQ